jgi:hypothetical protein
MELPPEIRRRFQAHGRAGGRARAARMAPADRRLVARIAALRRWTVRRFGSASFAELGLPGGDVIDRGVADLAAGRESVESLVVSLAAPRLRREGVPLPRDTHPDPDQRLYRLLEQTAGDLAHARYLAHLRQAASFADACRLARREGSDRAA